MSLTIAVDGKDLVFLPSGDVAVSNGGAQTMHGAWRTLVGGAEPEDNKVHYTLDGADQTPIQTAETTVRDYEYSAFWYSLGLFLPVVDVRTASLWVPRYQGERADFRSKWRLLYMRLHILAGWVLVPIGIASLTGNIK